MTRPLIILALLALSAGAARAETPIITAEGADAPIAAGASTPAAPPLEPAASDPSPPIPLKPDNHLHGEMSVSVGTGGYRSGYLAVSGPIGDRGYAGIAIGETRNNRRGGWIYGASPQDLAEPRQTGASCVVVDRADGLGDPTLGNPNLSGRYLGRRPGDAPGDPRACDPR